MIRMPVQEKKGTLSSTISPVYTGQVSSDEFAIITGNRDQFASDNAASWTYEKRRSAQPILDYLYLGPTSVIRDHDFLQREGITMILVARNARAPMTLASVSRASTELGIACLYIDVEPYLMVRSFYTVIGHINNHRLAIHQAQLGRQDHGFGFGAGGIKQGKVLVVCESGNDRSPPLVAAYIMAMYGQNWAGAAQHIGLQRFCCGFDEPAKRALVTWDGMVRAGASCHFESAAQTQGAVHVENRAKPKRSLDDMRDMIEENEVDMDAQSVADYERFQGRGTFTPFMEMDEAMA